MTKAAIFVVASTIVLTVSDPHAQEVPPAAAILAPTNHPRLPRDLTQLWMVPEARPALPSPPAELAVAVKLQAEGQFAKALVVLSQPAMRQGPLSNYADYYTGVAQFRLGRVAEARRTFQTIQTRVPVGFLAEAAALREAECDESLGDTAAAVAIYERLSRTPTTAPDDVLWRLGRAARSAGIAEKANDAYGRIYYEYPLSDVALSAGAEVERGPLVAGTSRYALRLARAERVFAAKRYTQARLEFEQLRAAAQGDDRGRLALRLAECEYFLKRPLIAKSALRPLAEGVTPQAEAVFFYALAERALKENDAYLKTIRRVSNEFPADSWADDALHDLGDYYIVNDEDDLADRVYRDLYARFPKGRNAEHAAWKIGWWSYRKRDFADTARVFERAAVDFARSDYRPMWLYWSGRAREGLKQPALAQARYALAVTDYANTYHGRLAVKRLSELGVPVPVRQLVVDVKGPPAEALPGGERIDVPNLTLPPNASIIRALLALALYDQAIDELKYAQKMWGASSSIDATFGWIYWQQGRSATGWEQFTLWRGAINAMKRAYPHYLASGGEELPPEILRIIYPLAYWDSIRKYAVEYNLDPYLAAALIQQESTFVPTIKSYANAWGLTQLRPGTARQYATQLKMGYTPKMLTDPEANLRIGMAYFAAKIKQFGQVHLALASYNAGERPVHRWANERPDLPLDEFIDDIPYPETNNYVKKLLSMAEDYRRLYSPERLQLDARLVDASPIARLAPAVVPAKAAAKPKAAAKAPTASKKPAPKSRKIRKAV